MPFRNSTEFTDFLGNATAKVPVARYLPAASNIAVYADFKCPVCDRIVTITPIWNYRYHAYKYPKLGSWRHICPNCGIAYISEFLRLFSHGLAPCEMPTARQGATNLRVDDLGNAWSYSTNIKRVLLTDNGKRVVLYNHGYYSATTGKHQHIVNNEPGMTLSTTIEYGTHDMLTYLLRSRYGEVDLKTMYEIYS
jgi:hypothetical protein